MINDNFIEINIEQGDVIKKYSDKYIVVTNVHIEKERVRADVVEVISKQEYVKVRIKGLRYKPPKYSVWIGSDLQLEGVNSNLGFFI